MKFSDARVILKLHRVEVGFGILAALVVAAWSFFIEARVRTLGVPQSCITDWLGQGSTGRTQCAALMQAWGSIVAPEGARISELMRVVPFLVGLLGGVPIVAAELQSRTAQTAWSLEGSRTRWLTRRAIVVALPLGSAITLAALGALMVDQHRLAWGEGGQALYVGLSGLTAVVRAFGAFGLGLALGVLIGRELPALLLGSLCCLVLVLGLGMARDRWLSSLPAVPVSGSASLTTGWAWIDPSGVLLSNEDGLNRVPSDITATDDPSQPANSAAWLEQHGYQLVTLGVPDEVAASWWVYDSGAFGLLGLGGFGGAVWLVSRRRPA